jgi:hypothetical protein
MPAVIFGVRRYVGYVDRQEVVSKLGISTLINKYFCSFNKFTIVNKKKVSEKFPIKK